MSDGKLSEDDIRRICERVAAAGEATNRLLSTAVRNVTAAFAEAGRILSQASLRSRRECERSQSREVLDIFRRDYRSREDPVQRCDNCAHLAVFPEPKRPQSFESTIDGECRLLDIVVEFAPKSTCQGWKSLLEQRRDACPKSTQRQETP